MRGQDDGQPALLQAAQRVPQRAAGLRIEARGGLVQQQDARVVHEGARDHGPLLQPAGEGQRLRARLVRELHLREQAVGARLALGRGQPEVPPVIGEDLAHAEVPVEVAGLRHHRDEPLDLLRLALRVRAVHHDAPGRGPHQARDAAEGRALARAVGAEQAERLARLHRERDPAHRLHGRSLPGAGIGLPQVFDDENGWHRGRDPIPTRGRRRARPRGRPSRPSARPGFPRARGRGDVPSAGPRGPRACPSPGCPSRRPRPASRPR